MTISNLLKKFFYGSLLAGTFLFIVGLTTAVSAWIYIKGVVQGEVVEVPNLFGLTEEQARAEVTGVDLELVIDLDHKVHSNVVEKDRVFLQIPEPGRKIKTHRTVEITLSSGPVKKLIPSLKGETLSFSRTLLMEVDAEPDIISRVPSGLDAKGRVLSQIPKGGRELGLRKGTSLLVSDGSPVSWYVMPKLVGRDYLTVKGFLDTHGFRHITKYKVGEEDLGQMVLDQSPKAGYPLDKTKTITLTVNEDF